MSPNIPNYLTRLPFGLDVAIVTGGRNAGLRCPLTLQRDFPASSHNGETIFSDPYTLLELTTFNDGRAGSALVAAIDLNRHGGSVNRRYLHASKIDCQINGVRHGNVDVPKLNLAKRNRF